MRDFFSKLGATLLAAALIANVTLLWRFSERLARIEARLGMSTASIQ